MYLQIIGNCDSNRYPATLGFTLLPGDLSMAKSANGRHDIEVSYDAENIVARRRSGSGNRRIAHRQA